MSAEAYAICAMLLCACTLYIGIRCGWELHKEKVEMDIHAHPNITQGNPRPKRDPHLDWGKPNYVPPADPLAPFRVGESQQPFPRQNSKPKTKSE